MKSKKTEIIISCMMIVICILGATVQIKIGRGIFSAIEIFFCLIGSTVGTVWLIMTLLDDEGETDESRASEEHKGTQEEKDKGVSEEKGDAEESDIETNEANEANEANEVNEADMTKAWPVEDASTGIDELIGEFTDEIERLDRSNKRIKILVITLLCVTVFVGIMAFVALNYANTAIERSRTAIAYSEACKARIDYLELEQAHLKRQNILANGEARQVDLVEFLNTQGAYNVKWGWTKKGEIALYFGFKNDGVDNHFRLTRRGLEIEPRSGSAYKIIVENESPIYYIDRGQELSLTSDELNELKSASSPWGPAYYGADGVRVN